VAQPVRTIYIIRHGEKPATTSGTGPDVFGKPSVHSLIAQGWHRAAALQTLFAPAQGPLPKTLVMPTELIAPDYGDPKKNLEHRTSQTILPLARLLGLDIETHIQGKKGPVHCEEGNEGDVGTALGEGTSGVTLACWEHQHIYDIARKIPCVAGTKIPQNWPNDRFDVIFSFTRDDDTTPYTFGQILQNLFVNDGQQPIAT
jgi:hypothetical protein